jgi:hypothetical protein
MAAKPTFADRSVVDLTGTVMSRLVAVRRFVAKLDGHQLVVRGRHRRVRGTLILQTADAGVDLHAVAGRFHRAVTVPGADFARVLLVVVEVLVAQQPVRNRSGDTRSRSGLNST